MMLVLLTSLRQKRETRIILHADETDFGGYHILSLIPVRVSRIGTHGPGNQNYSDPSCSYRVVFLHSAVACQQARKEYSDQEGRLSSTQKDVINAGCVRMIQECEMLRIDPKMILIFS